MLGLVTLLTVGFLLCFMLFLSPKKRLESMTDVPPSKGHAQPKLPSLTLVVFKLSSFYLKQVN